MLTTEDGWLAGMLEGEGVIDVKRGTNRSPRLRIRLKMVDEDVVARVAEMWGASYRLRPCPPWQDQYETEVIGLRAEQVATRLLPLFGQRRKQRIEQAMSETTTTRTRTLRR